MATPNLKYPYQITDCTVSIPVSTAEKVILINYSAPDNTVLRVTRIQASSVAGASISLFINRSGSKYYFAPNLTLAANSNIDVLSSTLYLEPGDTLYGISTGSVNVIVSYTAVMSDGRIPVEYFILSGGGGGGGYWAVSRYYGGQEYYAGGAGSSAVPVSGVSVVSSSTAVLVTVGGAGAGGVSGIPSTNGSSGSDSVFSGIAGSPGRGGYSYTNGSAGASNAWYYGGGRTMNWATVGGGGAGAGGSASAANGGPGINVAVTGSLQWYAGGGAGGGSGMYYFDMDLGYWQYFNYSPGGNNGVGAGTYGSTACGGVVIISYPIHFKSISVVPPTIVSNGVSGSSTPDKMSYAGRKLYVFSSGTGNIRW